MFSGVRKPTNSQLSGRCPHHSGECSASHTDTTAKVAFSQKSEYAAAISAPVRKGEVGCNRPNVSNSLPSILYPSRTSSTISQELAVSVAVAPFLRKGTCAPYSLAISAYFLESVETITSSKQPEFTAASMVYAINGLPHKSLIFLSSKPFDPLLAGIIARFFTMFIDHKISSSDPSSRP